MPRRVRLRVGGRGRRRLPALLALLAAVAVVVVLVERAVTPAPPSVESQPSGSALGTVTVQRRDLVATDTESGTVGYADPRTAYNRLSGTITWLPRVGQVIKPGQTLFRINGEPVVLMDGAAPAFRKLSASDSPGADIEQLNRNLVRLGFNADGIVDDDDWQSATTVGVELLQESLGETQTGTLSLGQVVFLPGARVISALDGAVGSTGGGGGSPSGGSSSQTTSDSAGAGDAEFVSLKRLTSRDSRTPLATPHTSGGGGELSKLISLLRSEAAQLRAATAALIAAKRSSSPGSSRGRVPSSSPSSQVGGGGADPATAILETSSTQLIVTVDLGASSQSEARVGAPVGVQLPSGQTVDGTITAVSPVAKATSSSGGGSGSAGAGSNGSGSGATSTVPVTIKLKGHLRVGGLDQASVSVNFVQAQAKHVLSVPVTALIAAVGGGYAVQQADAPHQLLPVTAGLFAAGEVAISGPGIHPGLVVTTSQG